MLLTLNPFTSSDQKRFAKSTGDYNPIHLDEITARSSSFGQIVVHGLHILIRSIDVLFKELSAHQFSCSEHLSLKINFHKPVFLGDKLELKITENEHDKISFEVNIDALKILSASLTLQEGSTPSINIEDGTPLSINEMGKTPLKILPKNLGDVKAYSVKPLPHATSQLCDDYQYAAKILGKRRLFELANLSTLVGMVVPGEYSLFVGFECDFKPAPPHSKTDVIHYTIDDVHEVFNFVRARAISPIMAANINAVSRPAPVKQETYITLKDRKTADELNLPDLTNTKCLIIGASRGLGALCAKLLHLAGADVTLTYYKNETAISYLIDEIGNDRSSSFQFDATQPIIEPNNKPKFDHIYYFATPHIFARKTKYFDAALLAHFEEVYINGFLKTHSLFSRQDSALFYPSTVEIDSSDPMTMEYRMSKHSGEVLCESLGKTHTNQKFVVSRLPRLMTDQTAQIQARAAGDSVTILSEIIGKMSAGNKC